LVEPSRDGLDDTVPARESEAAEAKDSKRTPDERAPVRPTLPMDRYRIGTELGRGGMGRVVEAFDVQLGRNVALKEVLTKGTHRRFAREIHITARLEHASIVPLYDSGINSDGKPFYVMRKVTGKPLDEMVALCRDLDERLTLLPAVLSAIDAVAHAHSRGIIHRDIKPQNILVGDHGETTVIDWGLAKVIGESDDDDEIDTHVPTAADSLRTQVGSVFGTPGFMAPEQARGEALDTQGDVYALGATLYQLLSGEPPVRGVSATEVMDKTRTHDIRPLAETAPGAPPDLVAIVGKSLAFDPSGRYRDASELGEDVRRFLAGQLVAAHDYTRWQKLSRFARRHRGILAVLAIAAVAVAVMSWIGVHRIITERDAAEQARHEADLGKREAEEARDNLADRHAQMVVMQARAELDLNPTESLAILKQLPASSRRRDEARAIAQAAVVRGAAWAMQTTAMLTLQTELAPDGRHLAQAARDGVVRVFDLDARRMISSRAFAIGTRADWITDNKLLITNQASPPQILDPVTNTVEPLAADPIRMVYPTASGAKLLLHTVASTALMFDSTTRSLTPIPYPEPVKGLAIAPDGSWYALSGAKTLTIFDAAGTELTRKELEVLHMLPSTARTLAVMAAEGKDGSIWEYDFGITKPAWAKLDLPGPVFWFAYRGRELVSFMRGGDIMGWRGQRVYRRGSYDRISLGMYEAHDDALVYLRDDGKLQWMNDIGQGTFVLPGVADHNRIASRRGVPRVAVVGDGVIQVFDLGFVLPRKLAVPKFSRAIFLDDDTLLVIGNIGAKWAWYDIPTGKLTTIEFSGLFMPSIWDIDSKEGRVLVREQRTQTDGRFVIMRKGSPVAELVAEGDRKPWARFVPGNAVIYGLGDAQVFAKIGSEPARMVGKVDGVSHQGVGLGPLQYAVHASSGEVLRGDLRTGTFERVRVPIGTSGFVSTDGAGRVLIVEDNRLMLWDGGVTEVAKFDREILLVTPVEGGIVVQVGREQEVFFLEVKPNATPHRVLGSSAAPPMMAGKVLVALNNGQELQMVEFPSRSKWTFPSLPGAQKWIDISPSGRYVVQYTDGGLALRMVPRIGADFAAWLDDRTNAVLDKDSVLSWPWSRK
jgi:tRNA A-37 threonylcarbamoyl transferase component Bud32